MVELKRIVLIGGPASGKSTLLECFVDRDFTLHHEISREIIKKFQEQGIEQLFLSDPLAFSTQLLKGRIEQFNSAAAGINIYDRGIPDVTAYHEYTGDEIPHDFIEACHQYRYDNIFFLPPWEEIYQQDNERYESWEQAKKIGQIIRSYYERIGYSVIEVPKADPKERFAFIKDQINIGN